MLLRRWRGRTADASADGRTGSPVDREGVATHSTVDAATAGEPA